VAKGRDTGMPPKRLWESFFDAGAVLDALGCHEVDGDAVDFGCGYGTFVLAAAPRVSGTVYGLDIDPAMVKATAERASKTAAHNVVVEQRDFVTTGSGRPDGSVGFAMLFNILHVEDPVGLLREAHRILHDQGTAAVIHWRHDVETPRGPPLDIRPRPEQCAGWAQRAGFRSRGVYDLPNSPWHWGMPLERLSR
jgi:SAM-dependent methyltransferase